MRAFRSVVFPLPVPPAHENVSAGVQRLFGRRADVFGERALFDQLRR